MKNLRKEVKNDLRRGVRSMDAIVMVELNITEEELEFIDHNATIEDLTEMLNNVLTDVRTFSELRRALEIRNKYLKDK